MANCVHAATARCSFLCSLSLPATDGLMETKAARAHAHNIHTTFSGEYARAKIVLRCVLLATRMYGVRRKQSVRRCQVGICAGSKLPIGARRPEIRSHFASCNTRKKCRWSICWSGSVHWHTLAFVGQSVEWKIHRAPCLLMRQLLILHPLLIITKLMAQ